MAERVKVYTRIKNIYIIDRNKKLLSRIPLTNGTVAPCLAFRNVKTPDDSKNVFEVTSISCSTHGRHASDNVFQRRDAKQLHRSSAAWLR